MTTNKTNEFPEIEWTRGTVIDIDNEERTIYYIAYGESKDGERFTGTWQECCDEVEIIDTEQI